MLKKILRYAQYDVSLFRHSEPKGEESVYTIFINCMFKRFRNKFGMTNNLLSP